MENKEMNDATSSRQLRPPVYPASPTTTDVPHAANSHQKHYSSRRQFLNKLSAAAAARFTSQAGSTGRKVYQLPPSPLSRATHASASGAGASVGDRSNTISQHAAVSGFGWPAGSP